MALYGQVEYWDERYRVTGSEAYDWYQTYASLRNLVNLDALRVASKLDASKSFPEPSEFRVLVLGCGNSTFAEDMIKDGWRGEFTSVDFSSTVIEQMKKKYSDDFCARAKCSKMEFVCADITNGLPFPDQSFDLVICKGTFDAILCGAGSVANAKTVIAECSRVLENESGIFFLVTYGNPDSRVVFLEHDNDISFYWSVVSTHSVNRQGVNGQKKDYVYICRKSTENATRPGRRPLIFVPSGEENNENAVQVTPPEAKVKK